MICYRLATNEDNEQLLTLTSAAGMAGETSLRIDRHPDFFRLLAMRGETAVFVAVDNEIIVGVLCVSKQQVYVNRKIYPLQYIGDFKVAAAYRKRGIGLGLCNQMAEQVIGEGADLAFLNVSKGNSKPVSFFSNRPGVPDFDNIGLFNIHQFTGRKRVTPIAQHVITETQPTEAILRFLDRYYRAYQLGPVIKRENLEGTRVFCSWNKSELAAVMCLVDTMPVKQNVVTRLSAGMRASLAVLNWCRFLTGWSAMPVLNQPVRMMYIRYLAVNDRDPVVIRAMVNHARRIVFEKSYSFVSIGLHEKDPVNHCFKGQFKFTFKSVGMLLSIRNNRELVKSVMEGVPFEDYSLV